MSRMEKIYDDFCRIYSPCKFPFVFQFWFPEYSVSLMLCYWCQMQYCAVLFLNLEKSIISQ